MILLIIIPVWAQLPQLLSDEAVTVSSTIQFKYFQSYYNTYWAAIGVRSSGQYLPDWDVWLYDDTLFANWVAGSNDQGVLDFVVVDYNHAPYGWYGIIAELYDGSGPATVEYEDYTEVLNVGHNTNIEWPAGDVIEIWDVYLTPDDYFFHCDITSGSVDLDIFLFDSNGQPYYHNREGAIAQSANIGNNGGDEEFWCTVTHSDHYGFCVIANNDQSGYFDIHITLTGIEENPGCLQPLTSYLLQNAPNPVRSITSIDYTLKEACDVELKIFDINGKEIVALINEHQNAGSHKVTWDIGEFSNESLSNGVYFYRLKAGDFTNTRKMVVVR